MILVESTAAADAADAADAVMAIACRVSRDRDRYTSCTAASVAALPWHLQRTHLWLTPTSPATWGACGAEAERVYCMCLFPHVCWHSCGAFHLAEIQECWVL